MEKENNLIVVKSNKLIESKYKSTLNEQRIILLLISSIKPEDDEFQEYIINLNDLKKMLDITTNDFNRQIKETLDSLITKLIVIKEEDGDLRTSWLSQAKYFDNEGEVALSFAPRLKPHLLQLKSYFTAYELDKVIKFKGVYSIRIYELLVKDYNFYRKEKNVFIYSIADLKEKLGINKDEYSQIVEFKRRVLDSAQKELKEKSDLFFDYECIKTKRTITDIKFTIKTKIKIVNKEIIDITPSQIEEKIKSDGDEITKKLKSWGTIKIDEIRAKHSDEVILDAFKYIEFEILKKKKAGKESIRNLGAYFIKILPKAGSPFEFTKDYLDYVIKEEQIKNQKQEEENRRKEGERIKEILDKKVSEKIEDLKKNSPEEWEEIEKEVRDKVSSEVKPPKQDKEEREFIKKIISELDEKEKNILELEAIEKAKTSLLGLGLSEDSKNFNNVLKSVKISTFESIIKEKYLTEIESQLKETSYYKSYEKRMIIESNEIRRRIIIKKLKDNI